MASRRRIMSRWGGVSADCGRCCNKQSLGAALCRVSSADEGGDGSRGRLWPAAARLCRLGRGLVVSALVFMAAAGLVINGVSALLQ